MTVRHEYTNESRVGSLYSVVSTSKGLVEKGRDYSDVWITWWDSISTRSPTTKTKRRSLGTRGIPSLFVREALVWDRSEETRKNRSGVGVRYFSFVIVQRLWSSSIGTLLGEGQLSQTDSLSSEGLFKTNKDSCKLLSQRQKVRDTLLS